jgi:ubiquitin-protein ligase E3 D
MPNPESDSIRMADPEAKLSLPEFIREPVPDHVTVRTPHLRSKNKLRSRSMSAPPLAWLLHPTSKASRSSPESKPQKTGKAGSSRTQDSGADG